MNRTKMFGAQLHQDAFFWKSNTYLAKIALVLQAAPHRMLTFTQVTDILTSLIGDDRKTVRCNINGCFTAHPCFVKIPVDPRSIHLSKKNTKYAWKLDPGQVTPKMLLRHFNGILHLFPELSTSARRSPEPAAASKAVQVRRSEAKFSGPFSIESLLKRDRPRDPWPSRPSPLSSVQVRVEQQPRLTHGHVGTKRSLSWDCDEAGRSPIGSAAKTMKRRRMSTESSYPTFTRPAPYFTSPHSIYTVYPGPAFT